MREDLAVLPRRASISKAAEILLTGLTFDGHEAVRLGLGSRALDAGEVAGGPAHRARHRREHRAGCGGRQQAAAVGFVRAGPRRCRRPRDRIHLRLLQHDDAKEGVRAFLEGRTPVWTGSRPTPPPMRLPTRCRTRDLDAGGAQVLDRLRGGFRRHAGRQVEQHPGGETGAGGVRGGGLHAVVGGDADDVDFVDIALPQPLASGVPVSSAPSNPL